MTPPVVAEVHGGGFIVASKSVPGAWRFTDGKTCSCPAGTRRTCRHRTAVEDFLRERNALTARPSVPVNAAALCD